jgi:hypothetical protein
MADYTVDEVITQCEDFLENSEDNYLILLFNEKIEAFSGLSEEEKETYRQKTGNLYSMMFLTHTTF